MYSNPCLHACQAILTFRSYLGVRGRVRGHATRRSVTVGARSLARSHDPRITLRTTRSRSVGRSVGFRFVWLTSLENKNSSHAASAGKGEVAGEATRLQGGEIC